MCCKLSVIKYLKPLGIKKERGIFVEKYMRNMKPFVVSM